MLISKLTKGLKRPIVTLNDFTDSTLFKKIDWPQLETLRDTAIIVEDLISVDRKQIAILKRLLNFSNHHRKVIYLV